MMSSMAYIIISKDINSYADIDSASRAAGTAIARAAAAAICHDISRAVRHLMASP